jgi:protein SCO1/2
VTKTGEQPALAEGDRVPAFTLAQNQNGKPVQLSDYRGDVLAMTFIYTSCPIPDYCPLMSRNFAQLQDLLPARLTNGRTPDAELLSVSFDPKTDTPQVLRDYAGRYTDDLSNWTFATGTPKQVQHVTGLFGVFTEQQEGQITHSLRTVVIGPEGRVRELRRGNDWTPQAVLEAIERVAREKEGEREGR